MAEFPGLPVYLVQFYIQNFFLESHMHTKSLKVYSHCTFPRNSLLVLVPLLGSISTVQENRIKPGIRST